MSSRFLLPIILPSIAGVACVTAALANTAVIDVPVLSEKTETKKKTVKLVPVQSETKKQAEGIKCAVTTGQQGAVTNPARPADRAQGRNKAQLYGPDLPANWEPTTTGSTQNNEVATGNFGRNQELGTAGDVIGGLIGSEQTVSATASAYRQQSGTIGQAQTIQGAWDQNSGIRIQNGLTWNQSVNSLNLFVQALNLANLMRANDLSRAATALGSSMPVARTGIGFGGQPVTCGPGQIVNPYFSVGAGSQCLDIRSPNTDPATAEALALLQAAARTAGSDR